MRLGLFRLALGRRLRGPCRQLLVAPRAELPRVQPQLGRDLREPSATLEQPLDRLHLELGREPASGPPLRHPILLGCWGSLANPPLPGVRSRQSPAWVRWWRSPSPL